MDGFGLEHDWWSQRFVARCMSLRFAASFTSPKIQVCPKSFRQRPVIKQIDEPWGFSIRSLTQIYLLHDDQRRYYIKYGYEKYTEMQADKLILYYPSAQRWPLSMDIVSPLPVHWIFNLVEGFRLSRPIAGVAWLKFCARWHEIFVDKLFDHRMIGVVFQTIKR